MSETSTNADLQNQRKRKATAENDSADSLSAISTSAESQHQQRHEETEENNSVDNGLSDRSAKILLFSHSQQNVEKNHKFWILSLVIIFMCIAIFLALGTLIPFLLLLPLLAHSLLAPLAFFIGLLIAGLGFLTAHPLKKVAWVIVLTIGLAGIILTGVGALAGTLLTSVALYYIFSGLAAVGVKGFVISSFQRRGLLIAGVVALVVGGIGLALLLAPVAGAIVGIVSVSAIISAVLAGLHIIIGLILVGYYAYKKYNYDRGVELVEPNASIERDGDSSCASRLEQGEQKEEGISDAVLNLSGSEENGDAQYQERHRLSSSQSSLFGGQRKRASDPSIARNYHATSHQAQGETVVYANRF